MGSKKSKQKKEKSTTFWDNKRLLHMRDEILPNSRTIQEALRKAREKWERKIDRSHFTHKFTAHFGHPPKQYVGVKAGSVENPYPDLPPNMNPVLLFQKNKELEKEIDFLSKQLVDQTQTQAHLEELILGVKRTPRKEKPLTVQPKVDVYHGIPSLAMGDIHYAEMIDAAVSLSGLPYNCEVSEKRIDRTFIKTCELLNAGVFANAGYPCFVLHLLGDLFSGYIHQELRENAEVPLLVAVTQLLDIITRGVDLLLKEFGKVYITCVPGNHSRLDNKPRSKNAAFDNIEWIFYYFLRKHYRDRGIDDVIVEVPNTHETRIQIYNTRYLCTHGAEFRGGNGITGPLLPWMRGYQKKQQQSASVSRWSPKNLNFDVLVMGHWHQAAYLEEIIVNGAIVEMGEYAHQAQFSYQPSCSNLWMTHPKRGVSIPMKVYAEAGIERTNPDLPADLVPVFKLED